MVHLITGYAGAEHIKSADQGSFNAAFFGTGQHVLQIGSQCAGSILNNNTVRIQDGDLLMYGRHIRMDAYEDVTITTGTAGTKRIDLIVMQYEKDANDGTEQAFLQVIKGTETQGTPTQPEYTNGNILNGATLNQMPLYKVTLNGVVLSAVTPLFSTIPTYQALAARYEAEFQEACETYLDSLNILDSKAEIMANTQPNNLAGALALKEAFRTTNLQRISLSGATIQHCVLPQVANSAAGTSAEIEIIDSIALYSSILDSDTSEETSSYDLYTLATKTSSGWKDSENNPINIEEDLGLSFNESEWATGSIIKCYVYKIVSGTIISYPYPCYLHINSNLFTDDSKPVWQLTSEDVHAGTITSIPSPKMQRLISYFKDALFDSTGVTLFLNNSIFFDEYDVNIPTNINKLFLETKGVM